MKGPDEINAWIGNDLAGTYRCAAEFRFWTVDDQPEADLFRSRIGEHASEIEDYYESPIVSRTKLADIIDELKGIRDDPLAADAKGDPSHARVFKEKLQDRRREKEYDAFNREGSPTWKQIAAVDPYHQFIDFLEDILKKCEDRGLDVRFTRSINM